jgi:UDP-2,4-diacetamido-2,4,6-trideoxy-beta-L-altropyranose hydrolase
MTSVLRSKTAFVVLDGYHFGPEDHRLIQASGHNVVVIDDTAHCDRYDAEMIVNQNLGAHGLNYVCRPKTVLLLGPSYSLLRREFAVGRKQVRTVRDFARRVLVTLGGADPQNITMKVIEALKHLGNFTLDVRIVAGPENRHIENLGSAVATLPFPTQLLTDVYDMADTMLWAELAITAAGSTCWELACLGVPAVTIVTAENQRGIAASLSDAGVTQDAGWYEGLSPRHLAGIIESLLFANYRRLKMRQRGREMVDGCGAERVVSALIDYACARAA